MISDPTWNKVVEKLHKVFDPLLDNLEDTSRAEELRQWLFKKLAVNENKEYTINNCRVAANIAFDITSGNLSAETILGNVLNRKIDDVYVITPDSSDPAHVQFHIASKIELERNKIIDKEQNRKLKSFYETNFSSSQHPEEGYFRCLTLNAFFNFFILMADDYKYKSLRIEKYVEDIDWNEESNFSIPFPKIKLEDNVNMRGGKPLSWIGKLNDMRSVVADSNPSVELANQLGITVEHPDEKDMLYNDVLILINYNTDFSRIVFQPSVIHADWLSGGYVGFANNSECYGRTFNCNVPNGKNIKERVHIVFPVITVGEKARMFSAKIIGRVDRNITLDYKKIFQETLLRYETLENLQLS